MPGMVALGEEAHAAVGELVLQVADRDLVAGDDPRGKDAARRPAPRLTMRMGAIGDARQRRARLALAAGAEVEDLVGREVAGLGVGDEGLRCRSSRPTERAAGRHADHRAADQADAPAVGLGGADDRVHPRDVGGEAGRGDLALQCADQRGQRARAPSASEPASPSTKTLVESQTMASTPSSPSRRIASSSVRAPEQRIGVDLPVAGVQHGAERRADRQAVRLGDRVGERDQGQLERAELDRAAQSGTSVIVRLVQEVGLAQLLAQQEGGERRGVERRPQPRPQPRPPRRCGPRGRGSARCRGCPWRAPR